MTAIKIKHEIPIQVEITTLNRGIARQIPYHRHLRPEEYTIIGWVWADAIDAQATQYPKVLVTSAGDYALIEGHVSTQDSKVHTRFDEIVEEHIYITR